MPEGRRPPPGACEKPRAETFAVARRKRRSAGERGLRMSGRGKREGNLFAVASGKRNGHWDRWEDRVGECGQGRAGRSGQALAGSGLCGGRGWGKNAWAGALRLRDRKNRAR